MLQARKRRWAYFLARLGTAARELLSTICLLGHYSLPDLSSQEARWICPQQGKNNGSAKDKIHVNVQCRYNRIMVFLETVIVDV
eukprot:scaffold2164_cov106-Cylindrotheca_fusiformis.AAC.5